VKERISILVVNANDQVTFALKHAKYFGETTDFNSNSQPMVYVRYKGADNFEEELLFCFPVELRSRAIDVQKSKRSKRSAKEEEEKDVSDDSFRRKDSAQ